MKAGHVALIGKPNVGKSTLLNALVGQKVSIVSAKPQTTRRRMLGIMHGEGFQIAFIDTPGIHEPHTALARAMVEQARSALGDVDLVVVMCDASKKPDEADERIARLLLPPSTSGSSRGEGAGGWGTPYLVLNKMDKLRPEMVVPHVEAYTKLFQTDAYMLTTATQGVNLGKVVEAIVERLPESEPIYDEDTFTDQPMRFLAAELIREKVLLATRQEVPHATAVVVTDWEETDELVSIHAEIIVEKQGQKAILIGRQGAFLKTIGTQARVEIEDMVEKRVFLELHVKVREDWRMNPRMVREIQVES